MPTARSVSQDHTDVAKALRDAAQTRPWTGTPLDDNLCPLRLDTGPVLFIQVRALQLGKARSSPQNTLHSNMQSRHYDEGVHLVVFAHGFQVCAHTVAIANGDSFRETNTTSVSGATCCRWRWGRRPPL